MNPNRNEHPEDELLEKYALGALSDASALDVEGHLFVCESCRARLAAAERFIAGLRGLSHGSDARPMDETHVTESGPIRLRVEQSQRDEWMAVFSGGGVELSERFGTAFEANAFLLQRFQEMFPLHRCGERCGATDMQPPHDRG
jgi:anti-sigma factor RsiW